MNPRTDQADIGKPDHAPGLIDFRNSNPYSPIEAARPNREAKALTLSLEYDFAR